MLNQNTRTAYVLEGLLRCHQCDATLQVHTRGNTGDPVYKCSACVHDRMSAGFKADELECWILRQVTKTIMTDVNTLTLTEILATATGDLPEDAPEMLRNPSLHPDNIRAMATDPAIYAIEGNIPRTRGFLAKLISHITMSANEAVVHYTVPLPQDSSLPGSYRQHLALPHDGFN